jgi:hypothetical protein
MIMSQTNPTRITQGVRLTSKGIPLAMLIFVAASAPLGVTASAKAGNPFEELKGDWKGGGTVKTKDGSPKKVDCNVTYKVTGSNLSQTMRCTGDDYEIDAKLKLTDKGGRIKGSWTESIYDASGAVTGNAKENIIRAVIRGDKFSGRMSLKVFEAGHSINIVQLNEKTGTYQLVTSLRLHRE